MPKIWIFNFVVMDYGQDLDQIGEQQSLDHEILVGPECIGNHLVHIRSAGNKRRRPENGYSSCGSVFYIDRVDNG